MPLASREAKNGTCTNIDFFALRVLESNAGTRTPWTAGVPQLIFLNLQTLHPSLQCNRHWPICIPSIVTNMQSSLPVFLILRKICLNNLEWYNILTFPLKFQI